MDSSKRWYLRRINTNDKLYSIIPFKSREIVIGRSPDSTFNIPNGLISRKHAVLYQACTPDRWIVKNLSLNGVFVNHELIPKEGEKEIKLGDIIQFGQPDNFVYRLGMKIVSTSSSGSTSHSSKRLRYGEIGTDSQVELTQEHASLEKELQECVALKARLQKDHDTEQHRINKQKELLEKEYKQRKDLLEEKYSAGVLEQQMALEEKEALAKNLENQVKSLQTQLETFTSTLEENLKKEEEKRVRISQEKEEVLKRLEEENVKLKDRLQQERSDLEEELKTTKSSQIHLQKEIEEKESLIKAKEDQQLRENEEKQQLKDQLAQEKKELESVKQALEEQNQKFSDLQSELKNKNEEMQDRMMTLESGVLERVHAEVEISSALAKKQLEDLTREKTELEEKLKQTEKHDKQELSNLQEALDTVEAQKLSLEQELACSALASDNARQEVVDSVADVLENELQCPICNELFITAIMLGCSHTFCKYCIGQWKKNKKECPNCRTPITSETRSLVVDNFIEKIVPTLSEELQKRRSEIVAERASEIAALEAQAAAQAAASTARGGRRGRGRGRNTQRQQNRPTQESAHSNALSMPLLRPVQSIVLPLFNGVGARTLNQAIPSISNVIQIPAVTSTASSAVAPIRNPMPVSTVPFNTSSTGVASNVVQTPVVTHSTSSTVAMANGVVHIPVITFSLASTTRTSTTSTAAQPITIIVPRAQSSSAAVSQFVSSGSNENLSLANSTAPLPGSSNNPIVIGSGNSSTAVGAIRATARPPIRGKHDIGSVHNPIRVGFNNEILTSSSRANQAAQRGRNTRSSAPANPPPPPQPPAGVEEPILVNSDSDTSDTSMNTDSSLSSESGDEGAYYGGYGRCFHCGRRGHWANGCPNW